MNLHGLTLCSRFAYPPNSLHLCGPEKQSYLSAYTFTENPTKETEDILSQFQTLYPYLRLIAQENKIHDPFDPRVVEAYWVGNDLLNHVAIQPFSRHLDETLELKKRLGSTKRSSLYETLNSFPALPHHSFHVLAIHHRTGHTHDLHTIQSMDACLINWGIVKQILGETLLLETQKLVMDAHEQLTFIPTTRTIFHGGNNDRVVKTIHPGDTVSYHWGKLCTKLTSVQAKNLQFFIEKSLLFTKSTRNTSRYTELSNKSAT